MLYPEILPNSPVLVSIAFDRLNGRGFSQSAPYFVAKAVSDPDEILVQGVYWQQKEDVYTPMHLQRGKSVSPVQAIPREFIIPIVQHSEKQFAQAPALILEIERFEFYRKHESGGFCNVRLYKLPSPVSVVPNWLLVMGEIVDSEGEYVNQGRSVINAVEAIAERFSMVFRTELTGYSTLQPYNPSKLRFISFLPRRNFGRKHYDHELDSEAFDWVSMAAYPTRGLRGAIAYRDAEFSPCTRAELEALIGQEYPPLPIPSLTIDVGYGK